MVPLLAQCLLFLASASNFLKLEAHYQEIENMEYSTISSGTINKASGVLIFVLFVKYIFIQQTFNEYEFWATNSMRPSSRLQSYVPIKGQKEKT